ncbi:MAG TPA: nitrous oxide reductase family maturation protein NosD [Cyclobacteriaceae bacterium]
MKKQGLMFVVVLGLLGPYGWSKTIRVSPGGPVVSIKEGISLAGPGDTVLIAGGVYREGNIRVTKSIAIIGVGAPVLDGEDMYEIFTVSANNVTISGLKLQNTGIASLDDLAAVNLKGCTGGRITDNELEDTFFGIHLTNSSGVVIENNRLRANAVEEHQMGNGIHLWKCRDVTIRGNRIQGHRDGIYFEFVTNSLIAHNHSEQNLRYGLHFMFSHDNEYRNNAFVNNGAGVAVMYTKGVKMIDNVFSRNWGSAAYGLLLKDISDSHVSGNTFERNSAGIFMEGCSRIELHDNTFTENGYAVRLQANCYDNVFEHNNFSANTFDLVTNGSLVLNKISNNYWDRYEGYDLNRDNIGDVPYRPVSMYSMIVEQMPTAVLLWRSFLVLLLDRAERALPVMTPENLKDEFPSMKPHDLD